MTKPSLREKVSAASTAPGVYLMKDASGKVIYVGKARNLKKRLAAYFFKASPSDLKTSALIEQIATFETIITATEQEALILEANLIKRYRPRYNVVLKDDKRYPVLRLDVSSPYPKLTLVRKIVRDDALYFGPFSSAGAVHQTLNLINRTFKLRKCKADTLKPRSRPCLNYQMSRCLAPCCRDVDLLQYGNMVKEVILFLSGRTPDLILKIKGEMASSAESQNYELAAKLRDKMYALEKILEKQVVVTTERIDRDILGLARSDRLSVITLLFVRRGYLVGTRHFEFTETVATDAEIIASFLVQFYGHTPFVPAEVLVPLKLEDTPLLESRLTEFRGKKVRIRYPQRGEKTRMIKMAGENAKSRLGEVIRQTVTGKLLLQRLKKRLSLTSIPDRIECFDNSNLFGADSVAAMVVFEKGKPKKSAYRKFNIRNVSVSDDYAAMDEVLSRRFRKNDAATPFPNLLMVDGGKGQLNVAFSILRSLGLSEKLDVLGIAKKESKKGEIRDKIFLPGRANPVVFGKDTDLLLFLQQVRDEAHRFAVSFHRKKHRSSTIQSALDTIPGVGKIRKELLLKHFRGVAGIRKSTVSEIAAIQGISNSLAKTILQFLKKS